MLAGLIERVTGQSQIDIITVIPGAPLPALRKD